MTHHHNHTAIYSHTLPIPSSPPLFTNTPFNLNVIVYSHIHTINIHILYVCVMVCVCVCVCISISTRKLSLPKLYAKCAWISIEHIINKRKAKHSSYITRAGVKETFSSTWKRSFVFRDEFTSFYPTIFQYLETNL